MDAPERNRGDAQTIPAIASSAQLGDLNITLDALGTVAALATVTVKSQIGGDLSRGDYQEGQLGLFHIPTRRPDLPRAKA
jgi:membrane fusion protein, multidrug efflux system